MNLCRIRFLRVLCYFWPPVFVTHNLKPVEAFPIVFYSCILLLHADIDGMGNRTGISN